MGDDLKQLRLITYMCPSHPIELFVEIMNYLEETLNCQATIIYEPREPGPTLSRDPFINDTADLVFLTSAAYIKMIEENRTEHCHLLPVAPLYKHPKNNNKRPVYYSDIIIHTDVKDHVKEFVDLRGCLWAYNYEDSLSGSKIVLKKLKDIGENATFFGNALKSGSHLETINMVLQKRAQAGAVDSNTLRYQRTLLHDYGKDLHVLDSLGPLPPYPILISKKIDDDLKNKITKAFLDMSKTRFWGETLAKFGIEDFVTNSYDYETTGKNIMNNVKQVGIGIRYY